MVGRGGVGARQEGYGTSARERSTPTSKAAHESLVHVNGTETSRPSDMNHPEVLPVLPYTPIS